MAGLASGLASGIGVGYGMQQQKHANRRADESAQLANDLSRFRMSEAKGARDRQNEVNDLRSQSYLLNQPGAIDQIKANRAQSVANAGSADQETSAALSQFGLDKAAPEDLQKRSESLAALQNRMKSMRARTDAGEAIDPTELQEFSKFQVKTLNDAFPEWLNNGSAGGQRKKLKDIEQLGDGTFAFNLKVDGGEDTGRTTYMTQNRSSDPKDPIVQMRPEDVAGALQQAQQAINARLISLGDNSPLLAQQAQQEAKAKAAQGMLDHKRDVELQNLKSQSAMDLQGVKGEQQLGLEGLRSENNMALQGAKDTAAMQRKQLDADLKKAAVEEKRKNGGADGGWTMKDIEKQALTHTNRVLGLDGDMTDLTTNLQNKSNAIMSTISRMAAADLEAGKPVVFNQIADAAHKEANIIFNPKLPEPGSPEYMERLDAIPAEDITFLKNNPETLKDFIEHHKMRPLSRWNG